MQATPSLMNLFLLRKLPAAYFCGVRVKLIDENSCVTSVKHRWINQNPFRSMYFAVQAMAAELSTGALVFDEVARSKAKISIIITANKSEYHKKASGRITFSCRDRLLIRQAIRDAIDHNQPQQIWLKSTAVNQQNELVSESHFQWSIKLKSPPLNLP